MKNRILMTDSYKMSQYLQYPPNTSHIFSYVESRGHRDGKFSVTVVAGIYAFLKTYLSSPITREEIDEAEQFAKLHGEPFNKEGWEYILSEHGGNLPLEIKSVPEGSIIPLKNVIATVVNTDHKCYWLTSYIETMLLRAYWYATTIASYSYECKKIIHKWTELTGGDVNGVDFKLVDFGARGVSSGESGELAGMAHLYNFQASDNIESILKTNKLYNVKMSGFSIPATEHSTITSWGKTNEIKAFRNMIEKFGGKYPLIACVSDSYDIFKAIEMWKELESEILATGSTLIIRPDSGDPVATPIAVLEKALELFGYTTVTNDEGKEFKLLPPHIRVIQGDGINIDTITSILSNCYYKGICADNISFGSGGALLQEHCRDEYKFAMKCSAIKSDGLWKDVYKDPITDKGKKSKRGRLRLVKSEDDEIRTEPYSTVLQSSDQELLQTVYRDGKILVEYTLEEIRDRINKSL